MHLFAGRWLVLAAVTSVASAAACGGNVVVDPTTSKSASSGSTVTSMSTSMSTSTMPRISSSSGGFGGETGVGSSTVNPGQTGAGGSVSCLNLPPLEPCGGSGTTTTGGGQSCEIAFCEAGSTNQWLATCNETTCVCSLNGQELCTCAFSQPGGICSSDGCCFQ